LKSIFRRGRVESELDEELQFHLEKKIEEGVAEGLTPDEARRCALLAIGGLEQRKEEIRDTRGIGWLTDFVDDVRYAVRSLRRTPGLTAFIVVTIAVGVGMTATPFSMLDALIFRPYPVPRPGDVVTLTSTSRDNGFENFSYREYLDIREHTKSYDGVVANLDMQAVAFAAEPGATPRVRGGVLVSGNYFRVLGVEPRIGRGFRDDEDAFVAILTGVGDVYCVGADLKKFVPGFAWDKFLAEAKMPNLTRVIVAEKSAFPKIVDAYSKTPIDTIRACACGLRTTAPYSMPGSEKSAPNVARPVTLSMPSWRIGRVPTYSN